MEKHLTTFFIAVCLFSQMCYAQEIIQAFPDDANIDAEMRRVEMQRKKLFEQEALKNPAAMQAPDIPVQVLQQQRLDVLDIVKQYAQKEPQAKPILAQGLMVFASFSIPDASLKQLARQTERAGGVMIFRGFKQGSLKETLRAIEKLEIAHTSFQIHPPAFTQYKVDVVPTVVLAKVEANKQLDSAGCALPDTYASVSGDTSLDFALEAISRHEKQFAPVALPYIEKLRGWE